MFVEAKIIMVSKEKMALPLSAVLEEDGNYFVMVLNSTTKDIYNFEKVVVKTGSKNENWVEIINTDNLLLEKQILIKGAFIPLEDG